MRILVTGGCGFIGSALVLHLVNDLGHDVCTLDAMTYAANPVSLAPLADNPRHRLVEADICDRARRIRLTPSMATFVQKRTGRLEPSIPLARSRTHGTYR